MRLAKQRQPGSRLVAALRRRQVLPAGRRIGRREPTTGFHHRRRVIHHQGVVIGSVEANFFTYDQLKNIEQFAARRGGGVLMLEARVRSTPGSTPTRRSPTSRRFISTTRSRSTRPRSCRISKPADPRGRIHAVTRLNEDRALSAKAWEGSSDLDSGTADRRQTEGGDSRPGGQRDDHRPSAKAAGRRALRARALDGLTANDTWRWRMETPSQNNSHETFWRQLLRYLVSAAPSTRSPPNATFTRRVTR